jgi:hypothetical protein
MFNPIRNNTMTTTKKVVKLSFGAGEVAASEALGAGIRGQAGAMRAFLESVIVPHEVVLADCLAPAADRKDGNGYGQAQFEFVRLCYAVAIFGADMAKKILATKTTDETKIDFGAAVSFKTGAAIKPNTARYVMQNQLGKEFKEFLLCLFDLQESLNGAEDAPAKRGTSAASSDAKFVSDRINAVLKRMMRGAEKFDGTVSVAVAPKFAKALMDVCKAQGIRLDVK